MAKRANAAERERQRILKLLESHKGNFYELGDWGSMLYTRLWNLINSGVDLVEEMDLPPEDRAMGFHWPDEEE